MKCYLAFLIPFMLIGAAYTAVLPGLPIGPEELPAVSRLFTQNSLLGLELHKASAGLTEAQCAGSSIVHEVIGFCNKSNDGLDGVSIIPHSAIIHDGVRCGTGHPLEYMFILPASKVTDETTADSNGLQNIYTILASNPRALNAFNVLNDIDPIHLGIEATRPRICGDKVKFTIGTIFLFIRTRTGASDLNFGFAYLAAAELGMITVKTDEELCLYKETRKLAPGQDPLPSPTPSPSSVPTLPVNPLTLQDAPNMKKCFPVMGANSSVPIIVVSPSPSLTPSPSPTPSKSSAPTPTSSARASATASVASSPSPSPSGTEADMDIATPAPEEDDGDDVCFPESAQVELECGATVSIAGVAVGDRIRVHGGAYSEVFFFTHRKRNVVATFLRLHVSSGTTLTLTPSHYIPVGGRLRAAHTIDLGDTLMLGNGTLDTVTKIDVTRQRGLFNPHTLEGTIVVDGIVASTFTETVLPSTGEALLSPIRFLYKSRLFDSMLNTVLARGGKVLAGMVPRGAPRF